MVASYYGLVQSDLCPTVHCRAIDNATKKRNGKAARYHRCVGYSRKDSLMNWRGRIRKLDYFLSSLSYARNLCAVSASFPAMVMHCTNEGRHRFRRRELGNAMPQIEYVPGPAAEVLQHSHGLHLDLLRSCK